MRDLKAFKRDNDLAPDEPAEGEEESSGPSVEEEPDLRAEDEALVAAELDAEPEEDEDEDEGGDEDEGDGDGDERPRRRRRGRRGGRRRRRTGPDRQRLQGTFDHGDEGYGLWLDPAVQDDPVYAEHWAGHRSVTISVEADRIVIRRDGDGSEADDETGDAD